MVSWLVHRAHKFLIDLISIIGRLSSTVKTELKLVSTKSIPMVFCKCERGAADFGYRV